MFWAAKIGDYEILNLLSDKINISEIFDIITHIISGNDHFSLIKYIINKYDKCMYDLNMMMILASEYDDNSSE